MSRDPCRLTLSVAVVKLVLDDGNGSEAVCGD